MRFRIGKFDPADGQVPVTFTDPDTDPGFRHRRRVVAVLTPAGDYDPVATRARVQEVALGVARKRAVGAFAAEPRT